MAAGIMEYDNGYFWGEALWHRNPKYIVQQDPVTIEQVKEIFNWDIEKRPLYYIDNGTNVKVDAYTLIRKDTNHVLVDHVGNKFEAESNLKMAEIVENGILKAFPDLKIEGVGTLFNSQVSFIQLKAKEFQVNGDKSPSFNRCMYVNPIGLGAYKALVHNERVVCANTLRVAESEGKANKSLKKFSHLKGAFTKVNIYMEELAEQWLMLDKHIEKLNILAKAKTNSEFIAEFLKTVYPQNSGMSDVAIKHNQEKRQEIIHQFNKDQDLDQDTAFSRYGLLQAFTYVIDHEQLRKDRSKVVWDNIAGIRMDLKDKAFNFLINAA